ncbi:hypothetical protein AAVH_21823 [Aphelenchoides avenae]|nr:hypothetical protein AAVH_21823 [Aphelenchus avenae]
MCSTKAVILGIALLVLTAIATEPSELVARGATRGNRARRDAGCYAYCERLYRMGHANLLQKWGCDAGCAMQLHKTQFAANYRYAQGIVDRAGRAEFACQVVRRAANGDWECITSK